MPKQRTMFDALTRGRAFLARSKDLNWAEGNELVNALGDERWVGQRVQRERKACGWSQAELARQMEAAGHPIHQSAISKIEPADPDQTAGRRRGDTPVARRSVTVGEIIGFSKVFQIPFGEFLLPPEAVDHIALWNGYIDARNLRAKLNDIQEEYANTVERVRGWAHKHPEFAARIREERDQRVRGVGGPDADCGAADDILAGLS